ncbi:hypothetical protein AU05_12595 [Ectopseudomonas composti]|uniref:Uncharacterized protein n=1 Tax=Ectopseudomonas composti TaxID=658457 RepID=A0ABN0SCL9_9GAMM|nr:hypothetical protein [Pseudomonas composti]EZH80654.1 hypothetical protein AU05_12595 [Pseudomonas composti]
MQQATWNHAQYLSVLSWTMFSAAITSAQLFLVFFPFGDLDEYVLGWPLGLSLTANAILVIASTLGRRDQHVRISLTDNGIQYDDEAESYRRNELLRASDIKKIRVRRNPFFKSLTINMKGNNQRFFFSNVSLTEAFLSEANALISGGASNAPQTDPT